MFGWTYELWMGSLRDWDRLAVQFELEANQVDMIVAMATAV